MPRARQSSSMADIPEGEPVGKLGKLRRQIADQADLVDDMGRELEHSNYSLHKTTDELEYHKNLADRGKQLEDEQHLSAVEELQYENRVLQLELKGVYETSQMYDYEEVDAQNRELRGAVGSLHDENVKLNQLIAEDNRAAMEREGRTRLFLEREYREQLKGAEGRIKTELYHKLDDRTKNIVLEHRRLQDDLFLLKYNIKEFDNRYRQIDDKRKILSIDKSINQEMNDMMVKEIVALKKKLAHSEESRHTLEDAVNQLRGQVHLMQEDGAVARTPEQLLSQTTGSATSHRSSHRPQSASRGRAQGGIETQQMGAAQAASLAMELQRSRKHEKELRDQRDKWRLRAFKLEQMCGNLQDDLSSAIDAAKHIVNQSETSTWASRAGWQDSDAVPGVDFGISASNTSEADALREWHASAPRPRRPASAVPTSSHARPGSAKPRGSVRSRPKSAVPATGHRRATSAASALATSVQIPSWPTPELHNTDQAVPGAIPEQAGGSSDDNDVRAEPGIGCVHVPATQQCREDVQTEGSRVLESSAVTEVAQDTHSSGPPTNDGQASDWGASDADSQWHADAHQSDEQVAWSGGELTENPTEPNSRPARIIYPHSRYRSSSGECISVVGMRGSRAEFSVHNVQSRDYPGNVQYGEVETSRAAASAVQHGHCHATRPDSARPPSAQSGRATRSRPVSAVWHHHSSPSQSTRVSGRPHSAAPTSSQHDMRSGPCSSADVYSSAQYTVSATQPTTVVRRAQSARARSGISVHQSARKDARPQSPLLRRGQSASDFIRRTRKDFHATRPFA